MVAFTFYMCNADGSSTCVDVVDLPPDGAEACADRLLVEHQSCAYVSVFQGDRPLMARYRKPLAAGVCLDRTTRGRPTHR